jgi:iron complex transport system substrate-binding protein
MYPQRIVCLAAEIPEIFHRLGALHRIVGISAYTKRPAEALELPKISGFKFGNIDRIKKCDPEMAILTSGVQKELAQKLVDEGIAVLHLNPHRLGDLFDTITLIGNLVGKPDEAKALNHELQNEMDNIRRSAAELSWKPRVYFEEWMDPMICGTAWVSDLIETAGGIDIFRERSIGGRKIETRVIRPEDVIQAAPDLILASWCGKPFDKESMVNRNGFNRIQAIAQNAVYEIDSMILQCGPMLVDSLKEIHRIIRNHVEQHPRI